MPSEGSLLLGYKCVQSVFYLQTEQQAGSSPYFFTVFKFINTPCAYHFQNVISFLKSTGQITADYSCQSFHRLSPQ